MHIWLVFLVFLWSHRMYIVIKVWCKTWNQGLGHSWNVLHNQKPIKAFPHIGDMNVKEPIYIVCWHINIIIDRISTPALCYLFMGQVLLVWPANKKKIKYWSNSFCLLIHLASSLLLYEDKRSSGTLKCSPLTFARLPLLRLPEILQLPIKFTIPR